MKFLESTPFSQSSIFIETQFLFQWYRAGRLPKAKWIKSRHSKARYNNIRQSLYLLLWTLWPLVNRNKQLNRSKSIKPQVEHVLYYSQRSVRHGMSRVEIKQYYHFFFISIKKIPTLFHKVISNEKRYLQIKKRQEL